MTVQLVIILSQINYSTVVRLSQAEDAKGGDGSCISLEHGLQPRTVRAFMLRTMASELLRFGLIKKQSDKDA